MPESSQAMLTHEVRIWSVTRRKGARGTTYVVKWAVQGRRWQRTLSTAKLADGFRTELFIAARDGAPFRLTSGLPQSMTASPAAPTWLEHATDYVRVKWPTASPRHRKGIAEALTDVTLAIIAKDAAAPPAANVRCVLRSWTFANPSSRDSAPDSVAPTMSWLERNSPRLEDLTDAVLLRRALQQLALKRDGSPAAPATTARKRATLNNVLEYAVELELFESNPLKRVRLQTTRTVETVDRRMVVNPAQARGLLDAVWRQDPALAGFFACLYFAGLRPAEARGLRLDDFSLPPDGWGSLLLIGSHQTSGRAWTDSGAASEERGLKHRARKASRRVPVHPELVASLRRHVDSFTLGVDGRLFVARTARYGVPISPPFANPVSMNTVYRAWHRARAAALTPRQVASMLARRPYDLRHACLSTWLNAGVPPAQIADWAGHSVDVLLRVYAQCVDGGDDLARQRIEAALGSPGAGP